MLILQLACPLLSAAIVLIYFHPVPVKDTMFSLWAFCLSLLLSIPPSLPPLGSLGFDAFSFFRVCYLADVKNLSSTLTDQMGADRSCKMLHYQE